MIFPAEALLRYNIFSKRIARTHRCGNLIRVSVSFTWHTRAFNTHYKIMYVCVRSYVLCYAKKKLFRYPTYVMNRFESLFKNCIVQ